MKSRARKGYKESMDAIQLIIAAAQACLSIAVFLIVSGLVIADLVSGN